MRWEIVYGSGKISNANADSTGFIVTSDSAAIRIKKRTLPIYEINGTKKFFRYDTSSSKIGTGASYGIRMYFETHEGGEYAFVYSTSQGFGINDYYSDSTFSSATPADTTMRFRTNRDCISKDDKSSGIRLRTTSDEDADKLIRRTYKVLLSRGLKGCYIYCEDAPLRSHLKNMLNIN